MELFQHVVDGYFKFQEKETDPRSDGLPLMDRPGLCLCIIISYLIVVFGGPKIMRNRQAWTLSTFTNVYNILQIAFCAYSSIWLFILTEIDTEDRSLPLLCKAVDMKDTPNTRRISMLMYANFLVRLLELSETVVHILRKKNTMISFLHVYHHSYNVFICWLAVKFTPGGSAATCAMINLTVHLVMYSYYILSSQSSTVLLKIGQKIKRYITILQIAQFIHMICISYLSHTYKECSGKWLTDHLFLFHAIVNLILFINFYRQTFVKKPRKME